MLRLETKGPRGHGSCTNPGMFTGPTRVALPTCLAVLLTLVPVVADASDSPLVALVKRAAVLAGVPSSVRVQPIDPELAADPAAVAGLGAFVVRNGDGSLRRTIYLNARAPLFREASPRLTPISRSSRPCSCMSGGISRGRRRTRPGRPNASCSPTSAVAACSRPTRRAGTSDSWVSHVTRLRDHGRVASTRGPGLVPLPPTL